MSGWYPSSGVINNIITEPIDYFKRDGHRLERSTAYIIWQAGKG